MKAAPSIATHTKIEELEAMLIQEREIRETLEQLFQDICVKLETSMTNQQPLQEDPYCDNHILSVVQKVNCSTNVEQDTSTTNNTITTASLKPSTKKVPVSPRTVTTFCNSKKHHKTTPVHTVHMTAVTSILGNRASNSTHTHQPMWQHPKDFSSSCHTPQLITSSCDPVTLHNNIHQQCGTPQISTSQHDTTPHHTQVISKQSIMYCSPQATTSSKHPTKLSSRFASHYTPQHANSHNDTKVVPVAHTASRCRGCMPQGREGLLLNSRIFLPAISIDTHTCRYHKKLAESMLYKRPMVLSEKHNSASKDQTQLFCQSATPCGTLVYKSHTSHYNMVDLNLTPNEQNLQAEDTLANITVDSTFDPLCQSSLSSIVSSNRTCNQCRVVGYDQQSGMKQYVSYNIIIKNGKLTLFCIVDARRPLTDTSSNAHANLHDSKGSIKDAYSFSTPKSLPLQQANLPQHLLKKVSAWCFETFCLLKNLKRREILWSSFVNFAFLKVCHDGSFLPY